MLLDVVDLLAGCVLIVLVSSFFCFCCLVLICLSAGFTVYCLLGVVVFALFCLGVLGAVAVIWLLVEVSALWGLVLRVWTCVGVGGSWVRCGGWFCVRLTDLLVLLFDFVGWWLMLVWLLYVYLLVLFGCCWFYVLW